MWEKIHDGRLIIKRTLTSPVIIGVTIVIVVIAHGVFGGNPDCRARDVESWLEKSQVNMDNFSTFAEPSSELFLKGLYVSQNELKTPVCLTKAQQYLTDSFFYSWKGSAAYNDGNNASASEFMQKAQDAMELSMIEVDRVYVLYFND